MHPCEKSTSGTAPSTVLASDLWDRIAKGRGAPAVEEACVAIGPDEIPLTGLRNGRRIPYVWNYQMVEGHADEYSGRG